ncbi:fasciclin domain-containing protein [Mesonia sp. K7]|uniref:fasciclin domain-containing protein n=1 Tax=Mesonia sp. K7 TaxID=2218606 RepID=UPI000DAA5544|nr:fasciclin domain-containing protein [Mesonia sp. K7]PZD77858.1 hypothetical protein DNG35_07105 [Mesonia sp. K7]
MKNFISFVAKILPILFIFFFVTSCVDDDDNGNVIEGNNSITDFVQKNENYSIIASAIERAEYSSRLDGNSGSYTFFAPDNDAMNVYLQENSLASVNDIPVENLQQLIDYHLLPNIVFEENFNTGYLKSYAEAAVNDSLSYTMDMYVFNDTELTFNATTRILTPDIEADNGLIHQIDRVMELPTMASMLQISAETEPFYQELANANLTTELNEKEWQTLFVAQKDSLQNYLSLQQGFEENILKNHWFDKNLHSEKILTGYEKNLALSNTGQTLDTYFNRDLGFFINGEVSLTSQDIVTTNGIIHILNDVLELPTLATFVVADTEIETLEMAFKLDGQAANNYMLWLGATGPFSQEPYTVFAPDNIAFDNLILELFPNQTATIEDVDDQKMTNILNYHFMENNEYRYESLPATITNTSGNISITKDTENMTFTATDFLGRQGVSTKINIQAINGVMHKIDTVLLPE